MPWKDALQSRAGSELLDRNRMIGWPTFSPCRYTSTGEAAPPLKPAKSLLKRLMQLGPHDGVPGRGGSRGEHTCRADAAD